MLAEYADSVVSVPEIFNYWLQAGRVDVGFLGAAQMDRYGNINTTVIGPYESPRCASRRRRGARDRGFGEGGCHHPEAEAPLFRRGVAFVTSVGHRHGGDSRGELGYGGAGPTIVITDLGILRPDPKTKELTMTALHPGTTVEEAKDATGWDQGCGRAGDDRSTDGGGPHDPARPQGQDRGITEEDLKEEHGRLPYNLSVVRGASGSGARKPKPKMRGEA